MTETVFKTSDPALVVKIAAVIAEHSGHAKSPTRPPEVGGTTNAGGKPFVGMTKGKVISIPDGTPLRHKYLGEMLTAVVEDGKIRVGDQLFDNASKAAFYAAKSVNDDATEPNGFYWWQYEVSPGVWVKTVTLGKK